MSQEQDLLLTFYGDDFTGSTDALEVLSRNGIRAVLFLEAPTPERLKEFDNLGAVGVAGISRSKSPDWMDEHLPPIFEALRALGAPICHYKVCSTFDSAPHVGSIGKAIDCGASVFSSECVPVVVGAPKLRRYQTFGELHAGFGDAVYRIDRHPVMSVHPITPMREADLRRHLGEQTERSIGLLDIASMLGDEFREHEAAARNDEKSQVLFYDVTDRESSRRAGELLWSATADRQIFCAGSSGVEYALVEHWRDRHLIAESDQVTEPRGPVDRIFVVSGSCSPLTERQIKASFDAGFAGRQISPLQVLDPDGGEAEVEAIIADCVAALKTGKSIVAYSAIGAPSDEERRMQSADPSGFSDRLTAIQSRIFREVLERTKLTRAIVSGGDTSSSVVAEMGLYALTMIAPAAPGAPLCRAHADEGTFDGLEIVLKGGQMGTETFFEDVRALI